MAQGNKRRYYIAEVSRKVGVPPHVLRDWEKKFPQLKPKRDRANNRYYYDEDIDVIRRIKYLMRHEGLTSEGARIRLAEELHGEGRPKTNQEVVELLDKITGEIRTILDILDSA